MSANVLIFIALTLCLGLGYYWSTSLGVIKGFAAATCRFLWVLPLILSFNPETITESVPNTLAQQPIHVLVDDSVSMRGGRQNGALNAQLQEILSDVDHACLNYGCLPKITKLSELDAAAKKGFTPLSAVLEPWLFKIGTEPWLLLTDGADWRPSQAWDERLRDHGAQIRDRNQGLLIGFGEPNEPAYWLDQANIPAFAFEGRTMILTATVVRSSPASSEKVQIQAAIDERPVASINAVFAEGALEAQAELSIASPSRGPHLLSLKALPVKGEKDIWDNEIHRSIDVMPNTIGVLHLLGAPSWDGRFLRRYFKAEPKFDLISFFILRDPWDSQQVSERELSLIPFPVERLFKDELANFRVLVIQNFTMLQFLQSEYQENLVKFVKNGGGLLFVGGPRALSEADLQNSPMSELLPFTWKSGENNNGLIDRIPDGQSFGSTYDAQETFDIQLAQPDPQRRALANVYDEWERMGTRLTAIKTMRGIHQMNSFKFKNDDMTPLLKAKLKSGGTVPLAVASYPGKGRALWLFSDSFWRLGMSNDENRSRFDYQEFLDAGMTWLMRNDRRPALNVSDFSVETVGDGASTKWRARLIGPASRYVGERGGNWRIAICNRVLGADQYTVEQEASDSWVLSGDVPVTGHGGALCTMTLEGDHPAFGSVKASTSAVFSETLEDAAMSPSPRKLTELARLTGAKYIGSKEDRRAGLNTWLVAWTGRQESLLPNRFKTVRDFYWILGRPWIWLVLLLLPAEILIRRWHLLVGHRGQSDELGPAE